MIVHNSILTLLYVNKLFLIIYLQLRHGENSLTSSASGVLATKHDPTGSRWFNFAVTNDTYRGAQA